MKKAAWALFVFTCAFTSFSALAQTRLNGRNLLKEDADFRAAHVANVSYELFFDLREAKQYSGTNTIRFELKQVPQFLSVDFVEGDLKKITEKTGGRAYFPHHERDLRDAFAQIQRDLREQYLVAYSPTNKARDGSFRKIEIQVVSPTQRQRDLKLNYRSGYFAKTNTPEPSTRKRGQDQ